jgi:apolipoprotein N-acyltransferase
VKGRRSYAAGGRTALQVRGSNLHSAAENPAARWLAAFLLGAASVLGFAPFRLFPLPLVTFAIATALWRSAPTPRHAAASGFAFGLGMFLAGVSWIYVSLQEFGGMPVPLAALATLLFCGVLALFPAAAAWLVARLRGGGFWRDSLLAAGSWTVTEWLRGWLFTGFPWLALGYSQSPPSPLAGLAPVVGVYGLSFLAAFMAALLALSWKRQEQMFWAAGVVLVIISLGSGIAGWPWTTPKSEPLSVSLLQGNIEQSLKWRPELLDRSLDTYRRLAHEHPARLVVLPETALPTTLDMLGPSYLADLAAGKNSEVLVGIVTHDERGRYYNSAVGIAAGAEQRYHKSHLVPFGEFVPPGFAWTLALLRIPMSNFTRGAIDQPPLDLAGEKVAVNICYEDAFGEEIIRVLPEATLLVNLSNVAWFGDSLAPAQHLQIAQLRALETGRYMLRATNTGKTAVVDPHGEIVAQLPTFTAGALQAEVRGYLGLTPYARWGNEPVVTLALLTLALALWRRRAVP